MLIGYAGLFPLWIVFYVVGVVLAKQSRRYSIKWFAIGSVFALVLQIIEAYYWESVGGVGYGIKLSSFLFSMFTLLLFFSEKLESEYDKHKKNVVLSVVTKLGQLSFFVYLTHYFIIQQIIPRLPVYRCWCVDFVYTLIITTILAVVLKQLFPTRIHKYLGL